MNIFQPISGGHSVQQPVPHVRQVSLSPVTIRVCALPFSHPYFLPAYPPFRAGKAQVHACVHLGQDPHGGLCSPSSGGHSRSPGEDRRPQALRRRPTCSKWMFTSTYQGRTQDENFYVTKDGQHIIRGVVYNLAQNPFQEDLDKLKTSGAPSFGPATAPSRWWSSAISNAPIARRKRRPCARMSPRNFRLRFTSTSRISRWSDSSLGQGRVHRRTLRLSSKPGRFLEVSRLDLRSPGRNHCPTI